MDQPRLLTPNRDTQMMPMSHTIPSWFSNSMNKKRILQLVSTLVKDTVTSYTAKGSKVKKAKIHAYLTKDPVKRKITMEVVTYKQEKEFGDIDEEGFKVTSIEMGTINQSTRNNLFKFSADHMLTHHKRIVRKRKS